MTLIAVLLDPVLHRAAAVAGALPVAGVQASLPIIALGLVLVAGEAAWFSFRRHWAFRRRRVRRVS